jgi:DNA repair protein RadC
MTYDIMSRRKSKKVISASNPFEVFTFLSKYANCRHEMFFTLTIDNANNVLGVYIDSIGLADKTFAHAREVFYNAIIDNATRIIIAHNHPAGTLRPSDVDIETTKKMLEAGHILGIEVIDHLIFSKDDYNSLRESMKMMFR